MDTIFQVILAVCFFFGVVVIVIMYLYGRFSHKHDFHIIDQQTIKRQARNFLEIDNPIYRKVIIQQCACGKMKKHTIDVM